MDWVAAAILGGTAGVIGWAIAQLIFCEPPRRPRRPRPRGRGKIRPRPKSPWLKPAPPVPASPAAELRAHLDRLTRDPDASDRLVDIVQAKHRDRDRAWCIQKAIRDIERDRQ